MSLEQARQRLSPTSKLMEDTRKIEEVLVVKRLTPELNADQIAALRAEKDQAVENAKKIIGRPSRTPSK